VVCGILNDLFKRPAPGDIVGPSTLPPQRARQESPLSDVSGSYQGAPNSKTTDLPTRLSGWFSHTFNPSSNDPTLPAILSQQARIPTSSTLPVGSPKGKGTNSLLKVAKHGKGRLDKAMRYLLDSDSTPDKRMDPIWILGLKHPGSADSPMSPGSTRGLRSPSDNQLSSSLSSSLSASTSSEHNLSANWPPVFYEDFTSRIQLTYRSQFAPIRDTTLAALSYDPDDPSCGPPPSPPSKKWFGLTEKGWTSDAGWGCMLRTSQSLLANTLLHLHLGRGSFVLLGF
jgi:cysteine protease ATG4